MNRTERIGVFGGTFDPIHQTHLDIAHAALTHARLNRLLFVVAAQPPHKRRKAPHASPHVRLAMVEAALAGESRMEASALELHRDGPSYTVDTLRQIKGQYPDAELFLIVGMDSLVDLPRWKDTDAILRLARLLVVPRPGRWDIPPQLDGHYDVLPFAETRVSSTEIRRRIRSGEPVRDLLPRAVAQLIRKKGIYRDAVQDRPDRRVR